MTDPTLTNEELAESDIEWLRAILWSPSNHAPTRLQAADTLDCLIAALRTLRAENASLSSQLATYQAKERDCWRATGW